MSWFQKNYEKAILGGAAAVALGLAYLGYAKYSSVPTDFSTDLTGTGNSDASIKGADLIAKTASALKLEHKWETAVDAKNRPVDLFVGIPLFIPSSAPETTVDPYTGDPIHPPIPNKWWIDHRLDPGMSDSPDKDPDSDGFSNMDEFKGGTDPNDAKSYPAKIAKLMYVKDESLTWVIRPSYGDNGKFPFNYLDNKGGVNKTGAADMIEPNGLFFAKGVMKDRFKLLGSEVRQEVNKKTNSPVETTYVRIEDQRPNKKGVVYEFPAPLSEERMNEHMKFDRTAIFSLEALGLSGKEFKVEENTAFALPPDSPKKEFFLKTVTPDSVTVEYTTPEGSKKTVQIGKGSMPTLSE